MRRFLFSASLLVASAGWLTAQEAARTGNSSNAGQSGQTSGTGQSSANPGQAGSQKTTGAAGQSPTGTDQTRSQAGSQKTTGAAGQSPTGTDQTRSQTGSQKTTGSAGQDAAGADQNPSATGQNGTSTRQNPNTRDRGANATNQNVTNEAVRNSGDANAADSMNLNNYFIACLRVDNQGEVEISKLATQQAANPEVKAFAQQMVKDHSAFLAKLDGIDQIGSGQRGTGAGKSREASSESPSTTRRNDPANTDDATPGGRPQNPSTGAVNPADAGAEKNREENPRSGKRGDATGTSGAASNRDQAQNRRSGSEDTLTQPGTRAGTNRTGSNPTANNSTGYGQLIQVKQEIGDRCLANTQRELGEKQGAEFDKCYVGLQVVKHMEMVDVLSVLSRHASGELQQVVSEGLQTAQQHLDHVKHIAKQIEGSGDGQGSRAPSSESGRKGVEKANGGKNN